MILQKKTKTKIKSSRKVNRKTKNKVILKGGVGDNEEKFYEIDSKTYKLTNNEDTIIVEESTTEEGTEIEINLNNIKIDNSVNSQIVICNYLVTFLADDKIKINSNSNPSDLGADIKKYKLNGKKFEEIK
jgi:hypothetical protein